MHSLGFVLDVKTTWTYANLIYHLDMFRSNILFVLYRWKKNMLLPIFQMSLMDEPLFSDAYYHTIKVNNNYKYLKHSFHVNTYLGGQPEDV